MLIKLEIASLKQYPKITAAAEDKRRDIVEVLKTASFSLSELKKRKKAVSIP